MTEIPPVEPTTALIPAAQPPVAVQPVYQAVYQAAPVYAQPEPGYVQPAPYGEQQWARPALRPPRSKTVGRVAMIAAICVFVLSLIAAALIGLASGPFAVRNGSGFYLNTSNSSDPAFLAANIATLLHVALGTLVGIWALVQGIVAVATDRGRSVGVIAIVLAALAPVLSLVIYVLCVLASAPVRVGA